jgi:hypothetical protein
VVCSSSRGSFAVTVAIRSSDTPLSASSGEYRTQRGLSGCCQGDTVRNNGHDVPAILIKGAATFVDNLYGDQGARMMEDIDFLVKLNHTEKIRNLLLQLGYDEQPDYFEHSVGFSDSDLPHHMPRFLKPKTPVAEKVYHQTCFYLGLSSQYNPPIESRSSYTGFFLCCVQTKT